MKNENQQNFKSLQWIMLFALLCVTATCLAVTVKGFHLFSDSRIEPFIQGADDAHYYLWLRSWVVDRDVDFSNDIQETPFLENSAKEAIAQLPLTKTGLTQNKFTVGWAVISYPFYTIAHSILTHLNSQADGYSPFYQIAVWLEQILLALFGFVVCWRILVRWFDSSTAIIAIMASWLVSPMIYYQTARISMTHNVIFVLAVTIVWLALIIKEHLEKTQLNNKTLSLQVFTTALLAGLLVICRPTALFYLILPITIIGRELFRLRKKHAAFFSYLICLAVFAALLGVLPQLLAWKAVYGEWIYYSYQGEGFNWGSPQCFTSLLGDHHGLFNWHPLVFIGLTGVFLASWRGDFFQSWIVTLLLIIWANSAWHMVYFGSAFGGRAYEFLVFFSMVGLAFTMKWLRKKSRIRNALLTCYVLGACWNILFLYLFMQGYVSREEPVSWLERLIAAGSLF